MTDLEKQMAEALRDCRDDTQAQIDLHIQQYGANYRKQQLEALRKALAAADDALAKFDAQAAEQAPAITCQTFGPGTPVPCAECNQTLVDVQELAELRARAAGGGEAVPVAWRVWRGDSYELFFNEDAAKRRCECFARKGKPVPLYTHPAPAAPSDPQPRGAEPQVWLYDFMDGATTVRNWSTTNKAEAFAPGNFNQRGYVPAEN